MCLLKENFVFYMDFINFLLIIVCVHCSCVSVGTRVEARGQLSGVSSFPPQWSLGVKTQAVHQFPYLLSHITSHKWDLKKLCPIIKNITIWDN